MSDDNIGRAQAYIAADAIIAEHEIPVMAEQRELLRALLALAYMHGSMSGSEETIRIAERAIKEMG